LVVRTFKKAAQLACVFKVCRHVDADVFPSRFVRHPCRVVASAWLIQSEYQERGEGEARPRGYRYIAVRLYPIMAPKKDKGAWLSAAAGGPVSFLLCAFVKKTSTSFVCRRVSHDHVYWNDGPKEKGGGAGGWIFRYWVCHLNLIDLVGQCDTCTGRILPVPFLPNTFPRFHLFSPHPK